MPAPFFNAIKGTTAGTPGAGAFTPNAASTGFRAWSTVPTGWIGLVRFEDGAAWELSYCYWNGTTLSRGTNQRSDSSSGSDLTLTSAATAAMVTDASEVMNHIGTTPWHISAAQPSSTNVSNLMMGALTVTGTAAASGITSGSLKAEQPKIRNSSATTANAQCGWSWPGVVLGIYSTTAGRGGFECTVRFGADQLPTGPRLLMGMTTVTLVGSTGEPSALAASIVAFAKDSTDTNIQLLSKDGTTANKTDTGIPFNTTDWFEGSVWVEPGGGRVYGLLINFTTGAIWHGSTTSNLPANNAVFLGNAIGGLSATTGTAFQLLNSTFAVRGNP